MLIMSYFTGNPHRQSLNRNKYAATFAGGEKEGEKKWGGKQLVSKKDDESKHKKLTKQPA